MTPSQRAAVIAEWRGLPEPLPKKLPGGRQGETSAAAALDVVMRQLGLGERLRQEQVIAAWRDLVGDFIAAHASPQRLSKGTLFIRVLEPTMHYELDRVWKPQILTRFQERFGRGIREIRFQIG